MRTLRRSLIGILLAVTLSAAPVSAAEQKADPVLTQLYVTQLRRTTPDVALDGRIATERARIRRDELKILTTMVNQANTDVAVSPAKTLPAVSVTTALEKQRTLVDALQANRQETKVDIDLLTEQETVLNRNIAEATGAALDGALRRKAELLSSRAVLEERLAAIDEVLAEQQDRLSLLAIQQRNQTLTAMATVAVYVGVFALIIVMERLIRRRVIGRIRDRNRRYLVMKVFTGAVYVLMITWALYRLSGNFPGFITSFAIVGAGIAVALQSVIKDLVGWILIVQKGLFRLGQRVTIGPFTGDVADISLFRTTLVEVHNAEYSDVGRVGQTLYVPNSLVLERPVLNFHATSDFVEAEIPVTVVSGADWKKAEEILTRILEEEVGVYVERARLQYIHRTAHFFATQEPPGPRVFVDMATNGILFTLRFQIPIGKRRSISSVINRKILERFAGEKIGLAFKDL